MNARQTLTIEHIKLDCGWYNRSPMSVKVAKFGHGGAFTDSVLAILSADDNPAPNPVVGVWADGDFHEVRSEDDFTCLIEILGSRIDAVQREDDEMFVILAGGAFCRLQDDDALSCFARAWAN